MSEIDGDLYPVYVGWAREHGEGDAWRRFASKDEALADELQARYCQEYSSNGERYVIDYIDMVKALRGTSDEH